jgi:hypothetical protein
LGEAGIAGVRLLIATVYRQKQAAAAASGLSARLQSGTGILPVSITAVSALEIRNQGQDAPENSWARRPCHAKNRISKQAAMEQGTTTAAPGKGLNKALKIDGAQIADQLGKVVPSTVEEALNSMLDTPRRQRVFAGLQVHLRPHQSRPAKVVINYANQHLRERHIKSLRDSPLRAILCVPVVAWQAEALWGGGGSPGRMNFRFQNSRIFGGNVR